jgi:hypothetical protein
MASALSEHCKSAGEEFGRAERGGADEVIQLDYGQWAHNLSTLCAQCVGFDTSTGAHQQAGDPVQADAPLPPRALARLNRRFPLYCPTGEYIRRYTHETLVRLSCYLKLGSSWSSSSVEYWLRWLRLMR